MAEPSETTIHRDLRRLLGDTARAHHAATGGPDPQWARWYAEYLDDQIGSVLGSTPSVDTLTDWLTRADARYRSEEQEESWPSAYATWFLEWATGTPN
jgi:hypothetical protein